MNIKEAADTIDYEKKQLQANIDLLLSNFEATSGVKISHIQLMRMTDAASETSMPFVLLTLEL